MENATQTLLDVNDGDTIVLTFNDDTTEQQSIINLGEQLVSSYKEIGKSVLLIVLPNDMSIETLTDEHLLMIGLTRITASPTKVSLIEKIKQRFNWFFNR